MKKTGILLAILLIAGVCAMADDTIPAAQGAVLFADIDAVAISQTEMAVVDGGQHHRDTFEDGFPTSATGGIVENPGYVDDINKLRAMGYLARKAQKILDVENAIKDVLHPIKNIRHLLNRYMKNYADF